MNYVMQKKSIIIAVSGDPGGANAVAPVIKLLQKDARFQTILYAYRQGFEIWKKNGFHVHNLSETNIKSTISDIYSTYQPNLILCGTSFNGINWERLFIKHARKNSIPSLAILDFWTNYSSRFWDSKEGEMNTPDFIVVMDKLARDDMILEGFDPSILLVMGNPAYDNLLEWRLKWTIDIREEIRENYNVGPDDFLVLFASQPLSTLYGDDPSSPLYPGYTEKTVIPILINALTALQTMMYKKKIILIIRPHPREKLSDYSQYVSPAFQVVISDNDEVRDIIMTADLITGMSSAVLLEAVYLSKSVVSIQPNLCLADPLPCNRMGLSRGIFLEKDLIKELSIIITAKSNSVVDINEFQDFFPDGNASHRILNHIYQVMDLIN